MTEENKMKFEPGATVYLRDGTEVYIVTTSYGNNGQRATVAYMADGRYTELDCALDFLVSEDELAEIRKHRADASIRSINMFASTMANIRNEIAKGKSFSASVQNTATNFDIACRINQAAGKTGRTPTWGIAEQQLKVIRGEFKEVETGVAERNMDKLRDGIADLLVTAYGMGAVLGYDVNDDYIAVTSSLWSRFDDTPEDAEKTQAKYAALGVKTHVQISEVDGRTYYATKSSVDQTGTDGEDYPADKFLKSHRFNQPNLPILAELHDQMAASAVATSSTTIDIAEFVGSAGVHVTATVVSDVKHPIHGVHSDMPSETTAPK